MHAAPVVFAGTGHGEQRVPHELTLVSSSHAADAPVPQVWKPESQAKPQLVPSQVAVALAGGAHGVQAVPQELVLPLLAHAAPHAW